MRLFERLQYSLACCLLIAMCTTAEENIMVHLMHDAIFGLIIIGWSAEGIRLS